MKRYIYIFNYNLPLYGICIAVALIICGMLFIRSAKKQGIMIEDSIILLAITFFGVIFGGTVLYIFITFSPYEIINIIREGKVLRLLNGGLVFYGGLIGGILSAIIAIRVLKLNFLAVEKAIVPYIPFAHAIGRVGCLLAGCCYGLRYDGIFAVENLYDLSQGKLFPIQILESLLNLIIMFVLLRFSKKQIKQCDLLCLYLLMYSVERFFTEFLRGDKIRGNFLFLTTSQWISILILMFCSIIIKLKQKKKKLLR